MEINPNEFNEENKNEIKEEEQKVKEFPSRIITLYKILQI